MVKLGDGLSTCREHGGQFAGDLAALDHLRNEHPKLFAQLMAGHGRMVDPDTLPPAPNRAQRRAAPNN